MSLDLQNTLLDGIERELYAAQCFLSLACVLQDPKFISKALIYAEEEITHANQLIEQYKKNGGNKIDITVPKVLPIQDTISFLVEYKAKEASTVSFYDTLINLLPGDLEKKIFFKVKEEEEEHLHMIDHFMHNYLSQVSKGE